MLAIKLLSENREPIARGVHKLVSKLHPRWAAIDPDAFAKNGSAIIHAVEVFLTTGNEEGIFTVAREILRIRRMSGFDVADFLVVMHCYLPVIRKAFIARSPTLSEGVKAYDEVESVMLPLVTRIVAAVIATASEITSPDGRDGFHGRAFERVDVGAEVPEFMRSEEEDTHPGVRRPERR